MSFEQWLKAKGFEGVTLTDAQRTSLMAAWKKEEEPEPPKPPGHKSMEEVLAAARAEEDRKTRITEIVARVVTDDPRMIETAEAIGRQAIEGKWEIDKFELEILRARRPSSPGLHIPRESQISDRVVEAAVCRRAGLDNIEKHFDAPTLEASERYFRNGLSLVGLMHHSAQRNGWRGMPDVQAKAFLRAAFNMTGDGGPVEIRAGTTGPSTYSLPTVLGNIANKYLRVGFLGVDSAWSRIAAKRSVNNFQTVSGIGLNGQFIYRPLAPSGEIKHGTMTETTYSNRASTQAIMIGISRESLINDDAGAFTDLSRHIGRGAGLKINDLFWTAFLNNSTFFTAGNNNVSTGAGSALGTADGAAINAAEVKFINQIGADGYPIAIMPKILLAPPTLANTARRWMGSFGFTLGGTAGQGDTNIFNGRYSVETSPYMENASYTGNSTAAWYLLASPDDMPVIEGVALNGRWEPTVDTAEPDFNQLGMAMRGYIDVGFALYEFRGGVRSAGS